jgi:hypothetical protein
MPTGRRKIRGTDRLSAQSLHQALGERTRLNPHDTEVQIGRRLHRATQKSVAKPSTHNLDPHLGRESMNHPFNRVVARNGRDIEDEARAHFFLFSALG